MAISVLKKINEVSTKSKFRELIEGKFKVVDVMGHEYYIVTNGKEMFSDAGEVQKKTKEHDLWANKGKKYNDFLMSKKEADDLAKELGNKYKILKVTTNKEK